jgi:hypothetical protein
MITTCEFVNWTHLYPHPPIKNEWLCEFMDIFTTKNTGEVVTNGMCLFEGLVWEVRFFSHTKFCLWSENPLIFWENWYFEKKIF